MVAPPGALRWATRRASFVVPGGFRAVAFEFLRLVAFAARDPDFFLDDLMVMVFSSGIAAQIGAATGASPGWPGVVALTLPCAGKSSAPAAGVRVEACLDSLEETGIDDGVVPARMRPPLVDDHAAIDLVPQQVKERAAAERPAAG